MPRRRDSGHNAKLSPKELAEFRDKVAQFSRAELETQYKIHHNACRYNDMRVPSPQTVQEFIQVWRRLWALKGSRMVWP